jgi:mitogen-activated protein kinase kinase kinase 13
LSDDPECLTKQEIVDAIITARDDLAELPPSSPYGLDGANSSGYSSDDGNIAGGEETDAGSRRRPNPAGLRRHVTVHDVGHVSAPGPSPVRGGRSFSLGHTRSSLVTGGGDRQVEVEKRYALFRRVIFTLILVCYRALRQRTGSLRSSPTASVSLPSPPATRLRSRKLSGDDVPLPSSLRLTKPRGKAKQVEFNEQVEIASVESLSDLTELSDTEHCDVPTKPSPRRLRSQGERTTQTPPKRKGKTKACNFGEDGDPLDDEVDELLSSRDAPPRPTLNDRTPVKRRLRPRPIQTHTPPDESDDGDDEGGEEVEIGEVEHATEEDGASVGEAEEEEDNDEAEEEDDVTLVEPRKLRNGKIVGEEDDSEAADEQEQEDSDESAQEGVPLDEEIDLEVDDDESDGSSHEEYMGETTEDGEQRPPLQGPI